VYFDGLQFGDVGAEALRGHFISSIEAAPDGQLLVGTDVGVFAKDAAQRLIRPWPEALQPRGRRVTAVAIDKAGHARVGTENALYERVGDVLEHRRTGAVGRVEVDALSGKVWALVERALYGWQNGVVEEPFPAVGRAALASAYALTVGADGGVWLAGPNKASSTRRSPTS
jgi:hypothetical protein